MNVSVLGGAGYVGLITGLGLAEIGHHVTNIDVDRPRIDRLQAGQSPIYEDGIEPLLNSNLDAGRLHFSTDLDGALTSSEVVFIAVGTPSQEDGRADLSQAMQVTEKLAPCIDAYKLIVIKSTVAASTMDLILSILGRDRREGEDFDIVANPEFLREGKGLHDFFYPDRIVIGTSSERARRTMRSLYEPIVLRRVSWPMGSPGPVPTSSAVPIVETDLASAQIIKYASNAFLAARVSFVNEVAEVCERVGADITEVAKGIGYDPRIGQRYLEAGPGFGGPCLEKDLSALINVAEASGYDPRLLRSVLERNEKPAANMLAKAKQVIGSPPYGKTIAVLGLSFKSGTNDVRNSPALKVIDQLEKEGANIRAHDPVAIEEAPCLRPHIAYYDDPYDAVCQADAVLILTEWPCFKELDYEKIKARMAYPRIMDARNLLDPKAMSHLGFTYVGLGWS